MVIQELKESINVVIKQLNILASKCDTFNINSKIYIDTLVILKLFTIELNKKNNISEISDDLLSALRSLAMSSYKDFENTDVEGAIENLIEKVYYNIPRYQKLSALNKRFDSFILENIKNVSLE